MRLSDVHVRRALPGDEPALRELRIHALSEAPDAFGSTLERELARSPAEWTSWLSPGAVYFLEADSVPKGLAAGVPDETDPSVIWLMTMWLHPDLRGSGVAGQLVEAVVAWAAGVGATLLRLDVIEGNRAAIGLYERHHFRPTGHRVMRARDGAVEVQMERSV